MFNFQKAIQQGFTRRQIYLYLKSKGRESEAFDYFAAQELKKIGRMPSHVWEGTSIAFETSDGEYGEFVDLQGLPGKQGAQGERGADGKNGSPDTGNDIVQKINQENTKEKIKASRIDWDDPDLKYGDGQAHFMGVGASTTTFSVETPTGAIDGMNNEYQVIGTITKVLNFSINGQYIHPGEYTASGGTITFTTPLPAALAGTNFTIVYV